MRGKLIAGAALAGIAGLVPVSTKAAEVTFSFRLAGSGGVDSPGGDTAGTAAKSRTVTTGQFVTLNLYAIVQDHAAPVFNGGTGTWSGGNNDDGFQQVMGSFTSSNGGLLGTWRGDSPTVGASSLNNNVAPFDTGAPNAGRQSDLDGDLDLDIGSHVTTGTSNPFPWFVASANVMKFPFAQGDLEEEPTTGAISILIGRTRFQVTSAVANTSLNFVPRIVEDGAPEVQRHTIFTVDGNKYFIDGNGNGTFGPNGNENSISNAFAIGAPVVLSAIPEPAALGLLGVGAAALLRRRKA